MRQKTAPPKRASWWEAQPSVPQLTVYEADASPIKTGLLDKHGNPIVRDASRGTLGYLPKKS